MIFQVRIQPVQRLSEYKGAKQDGEAYIIGTWKVKNVSDGSVVVVSCFTKDDETLFLYFKLALNTGARLSTLQNIYKKDIDFAHNLLALKDFKNNSTYKTFLNEELLGLLNKRVEQLNPNDKIFISNPERRMRQILDDLFNIGIDKNDRKNKVVFHTLRHTFASHLAINGVPIFTIQKLMNHKEIKMTLRYAKLSPDSGREALMNLGL